jgi:hypothetical protein
MEKKYKITFTNEYEYDFYPEEKRNHWQPIVKELKDKEVSLEEIPALIERFGEVILSGDEVEIYNYYRE